MCSGLIISRIYKSPCGELMLGSFGDRLCLCDWLGGRNSGLRRLCAGLKAGFAEGSSPVIEDAMIQLDEYFAGSRRQFDIPLLFVGTDFRKKVWDELLRIPYGHTVSYSNIAYNIGKPLAVRAVANAVGANVISVIAPCHRVIGSDGSLTGYAGGLNAKRFLLDLEGMASDLFEP